MIYFFTVIDWISLLFNSFWIIGTAILLAAFSFHTWQAQQSKTPLRKQLTRPAFSRLYWAGLTCIGIGLAGTSQYFWETVIWLAFVIISAANTYKLATESKKER
jgi:hypothetical protein